MCVFVLVCESVSVFFNLTPQFSRLGIQGPAFDMGVGVS